MLRPPGGRRVVRLGRWRLTYRPRTAVVTAVLVVLALALGVLALGLGALGLSPWEVAVALAGQGPERDVRVVQGIRLPRVLTALAAGAALGVSGGIFQSVSRNALGSPDVIGFTTGAASGALVMIVLGGGSGIQVSLAALIGGVLTAAVVMILARSRGTAQGRQLVLVGIGIGAILGALNSLLLVRGDLDSSVQANLWLSGSLDARSWEHAVPALIGVAILTPLALLLARSANAMELGDDLARQLGVSVDRARLALVIVAVLLASIAVAATGPIAFIALAAPQLARRLTRAPEMPVVPAAAMGAALLVAADVLTQSLPLALTVPIGRMTGVVGGVYLLWLLMPTRTRSSI